VQTVAGSKAVVEALDRRQDELEDRVVPDGLTVLMGSRSAAPRARQQFACQNPVEPAPVESLPGALRMATMGEIVAQPEIKADQGDRLRNRHGVAALCLGSPDGGVKQHGTAGGECIRLVVFRGRGE
jgi:hypothetical protein